MMISRLHLKNWRNFKGIEVHLRERVFVIGPNASGKSNFLDVLRFLRDIAKPEGGDLQRAVKDRGGITKLRSLFARKDTEVLIEVDLTEKAGDPASWRYTLGFKSEGTGLQRVVVTKEVVTNLISGERVVDRPSAADKKDKELLTQTHLQQISANKDFRHIVEFFASLTYLHLVPQLLKHGDQIGGSRLDGDPFGQSFLERIAKTPARYQESRLRKIEEALRVCVPQMRDLRFKRDDATGRPHLEALYEHWRPDAGWQREEQFSDGTLRLLGIMWSLLDGEALLLLEEPELSLSEGIVSQIAPLIWQVQRRAKHRRQVFITTHSEALLNNKSIDAREVIRLEPSTDGTLALEATPQDVALVEAGYSVAEAMLTKVRPGSLVQLELL
jgi:predicted ATPase